MRIAADGYIDLTDGRRVKTPGNYAHAVEPAPEAEALSFLLSHSFRGHRRVVRPLNLEECKRIKLAMWANSVSARMTLIDRVWRAITEPVLELRNTSDPELIQVVQFEHWAYPIYFDGGYTRVIPLGAVSLAEVPPELVIRLDGQLVA